MLDRLQYSQVNLNYQKTFTPYDICGQLQGLPDGYVNPSAAIASVIAMENLGNDIAHLGIFVVKAATQIVVEICAAGKLEFTQ